MPDKASVDYLRKIKVSLEAGMTSEAIDLTETPVEFEFIYGIGTDGISPFEKALFGKQKGDQILIELSPTQNFDLLCHLKNILPEVLPPEALFLKATIQAIEKADSRELIQAIAAGTDNKGCDCGCGCSC